MDLRKVFGATLTILGTLALIYAAYAFITGTKNDWKTLVVCTILGIIFFSSGINLIKSYSSDK